MTRKTCLECGREFAARGDKKKYCSYLCGHRYRYAAQATEKTRRESRRRAAQAAQIDLGLAVSGATLRPGQCRTCDELAAYCGCSRTNIEYILQGALRKMRRKLAALGLRPGKC